MWAEIWYWFSFRIETRCYGYAARCEGAAVPRRSDVFTNLWAMVRGAAPTLWE